MCGPGYAELAGFAAGLCLVDEAVCCGCVWAVSAVCCRATCLPSPQRLQCSCFLLCAHLAGANQPAAHKEGGYRTQLANQACRSFKHLTSLDQQLCSPSVWQRCCHAANGDESPQTGSGGQRIRSHQANCRVTLCSGSAASQHVVIGGACGPLVECEQLKQWSYTGYTG
jgi:hypothetical protein